MPLPETHGMPTAHVEAAKSADGLCLAATGAGCIAQSIYGSRTHVGTEVPLLATTRCRAGRHARETDGFPSLPPISIVTSIDRIQSRRTLLINPVNGGLLENAGHFEGQ